MRASIIASIEKFESVKLVKKSRAMYSTVDNSVRVCCSISKLHERGLYWYAYHPHWNSFLKESEKGLFVLGCIGLNRAYCLPAQTVEEYLDKLYITDRGDKIYYHIYLEPQQNGNMVWPMRDGTRLDLSQYEIQTS